MKRLRAVLLALACVLAMSGCSKRSMNHVIANEPSITGVVRDAQEQSVLIENEKGEYWVSLDVEIKDSMTHFSIGDEVVVYYDGNIAETYPMQINKVYAITLKTPADRMEVSEPQNEVLQFFADRYDMSFKLWGPEGNDLYAFYIYPDYAEWECHILMPANTDDIAQYQKDLSWEVVGDELIIRGAGSQEPFKIDLSMETATSATTGRVYKIYAMDPPIQ